MSADQPAPPVHAEEKAIDDHGHGEHGDEEPALGPIDVTAWAAAIGGVLIGAAIAFCFVLATAPA